MLMIINPNPSVRLKRPMPLSKTYCEKSYHYPVTSRGILLFCVKNAKNCRQQIHHLILTFVFNRYLQIIRNNPRCERLSGVTNMIISLIRIFCRDELRDFGGCCRWRYVYSHYV